MMRKIKFFTLDVEKEKFIERFLSDLLDAPDYEDAQKALEEVDQKLNSSEHILTQKLVQRIALSRAEIENLVQEITKIIIEIHNIKHSLPDEVKSKCDEIIDLFNKLREELKSLIRLLEESQDREFGTKLLNCVFDLLEGMYFLCFIAETYGKQLGLKEHAEKICDALKKLLDHSTFSDIRSYHKLKNLKEILKEITVKFKEDYLKLKELARAYQLYRPGSILFRTEVFDEIIYQSKAFNLLGHAMESLGIGVADLADAYMRLRMLTERFYIRGEDWYNTVPALAYVLFHLTERVSLDELLDEIESFVRAELVNIYRSSSNTKEKDRLFTEFFYNLTKILLLVLCLEAHVDWRLAVALGASAARYWSRWNDESSFIELFDGLRALCEFTTREEAERVLTYAALFGDFDLIVKLGPILRAHGSLRSINLFT